MNSPEYTVLIIGGYGAFGGRLARAIVRQHSSRAGLIALVIWSNK